MFGHAVDCVLHCHAHEPVKGCDQAVSQPFRVLCRGALLSCSAAVSVGADGLTIVGLGDSPKIAVLGPSAHICVMMVPRCPPSQTWWPVPPSCTLGLVSAVAFSPGPRTAGQREEATGVGCHRILVCPRSGLWGDTAETDPGHLWRGWELAPWQDGNAGNSQSASSAASHPLTPSLSQDTFAELCVPGCSERQGLLVTTRGHTALGVSNGRQ